MLRACAPISPQLLSDFMDPNEIRLVWFVAVALFRSNSTDCLHGLIKIWSRGTRKNKNLYSQDKQKKTYIHKWNDNERKRSILLYMCVLSARSFLLSFSVSATPYWIISTVVLCDLCLSAVSGPQTVKPAQCHLRLSHTGQLTPHTCMEITYRTETDVLH